MKKRPETLRLRKAKAIQLKLPACERSREQIAGNLVLQLVEAEQLADVTVLPGNGKNLTVSDSRGRELVVYPKGSRALAGHPAFSLRIQSPGITPDQISPSTEFKWVSHPGSELSIEPDRIREAWRDAFRFIAEDPAAGKKGLRPPQLGALHAIASHWSTSEEAATVVMPTGTGKTETMFATLAYCQCPRVLVMVPTDVLRTQTFRKFCTLGCLREVGALPLDAPLPRVAIIKTGLKSASDAEALAKASNVLVATAAVLSSSDDAALEALVSHCTHLFVDEAHHLPARTWDKVKTLFNAKPVLQFTATPYRKDKKQIGGKLIFNYPLGKAQEAGYFQPIDLLTVEELDDQRADRAIASEVIARLEEDLKQGFDHLVLARVRSIPRAAEVLGVYQSLGKKFKPVAINSDTLSGDRLLFERQIKERKSRILVCVNMFGEGFDLPQLKIAGMHDIHKSLPITLQFVGRFVRSAEEVGNASVVVNMADPRVDSELQALYAGDKDWNTLLRRSSERRIAREKSLQEFIDSFTGDLPEQLPLWNLRPGHSTVVYRTNSLTWQPESLKAALPKKAEAWAAVSEKERIAIAVIAKQEDVRWGRYQNIKDHFWNLVIAHWAKEQGLLFVYASDYKVVKAAEIAKALCGASVSLVNGPKVFRVFSNIERPMVKNLGASKSGTISFTMYFGAEVSAGLSQVEKAESDLNNVFGWGYEAGELVTQGCSARHGKLWAASGGPVMDWRKWCEGVGRKLTDDTIPDAEVIKGFLRPVELSERPTAIPSQSSGAKIIREEETACLFTSAGGNTACTRLTYELPAMRTRGQSYSTSRQRTRRQVTSYSLETLVRINLTTLTGK